MIRNCRIRSNTKFRSSYVLDGVDCENKVVKISKLINGNESPFFYSLNSGQKLMKHMHYFIFLTPKEFSFYGKSNNFIEHYRQLTNWTRNDPLCNHWLQVVRKSSSKRTIRYKLFRLSIHRT